MLDCAIQKTSILFLGLLRILLIISVEEINRNVQLYLGNNKLKCDIKNFYDKEIYVDKYTLTIKKTTELLETQWFILKI